MSARAALQRACLVAAISSSLGAGCGARVTAPLHARELFPTGPYSQPGTFTMPCEEAQRYVLAQKQLPMNLPPPIPGDDRLPLTVKLDVRAKLIDVVALELVHQDPSYRLYVGVAPRDQLAEDIVMPAPEAWWLMARVLVRSRVQGGLFDQLSYCHEQWTQVELAPEERTVTLVVDDDQRTAATHGGVVWFDAVLERESDEGTTEEDEEVAAQGEDG